MLTNSMKFKDLTFLFFAIAIFGLSFGYTYYCVWINWKIYFRMEQQDKRKRKYQYYTHTVHILIFPVPTNNRWFRWFQMKQICGEKAGKKQEKCETNANSNANQIFRLWYSKRRRFAIANKKLFICATRRNFYIFYCMRLAYVRLSHFFSVVFLFIPYLIIILLALLFCLFAFCFVSFLVSCHCLLSILNQLSIKYAHIIPCCTMHFYSSFVFSVYYSSPLFPDSLIKLYTLFRNIVSYNSGPEKCDYTFIAQ